jgi:hypothetical protein
MLAGRGCRADRATTPNVAPATRLVSRTALGTPETLTAQPVADRNPRSGWERGMRRSVVGTAGRGLRANRVGTGNSRY